MKKLITIFFLLWKSAVCISQIYLPVNPTDFGTNFNRVKALQVLHIPVFGDTLLRTTDTSAQLRVINGQLFYHSGYWRPAGGGGGGNLQTTLNLGSVLTRNNTIKNTGFQLGLDGGTYKITDSSITTDVGGGFSYKGINFNDNRNAIFDGGFNYDAIGKSFFVTFRNATNGRFFDIGVDTSRGFYVMRQLGDYMFHVDTAGNIFMPYLLSKTTATKTVYFDSATKKLSYGDAGGTIPDLQQVTDKGSNSTNQINLSDNTDGTGASTYLAHGYFSLSNVFGYGTSVGSDYLSDIYSQELPDANGTYAVSASINGRTHYADASGNIDLGTISGSGIGGGGGGSISMCTGNPNGTTITSIIPNQMNATATNNTSTSISFITNITFASGNVFTAEMSDEHGDFSGNITVLGHITSNTNSTIAGIVPANMTPGIYSIQIVSSNPASCSSNKIQFTINDVSNVHVTDTAAMLSPYLRNNVAASTYVPYTGATQGVDLGSQTLKAGTTTTKGEQKAVRTISAGGVTLSLNDQIILVNGASTSFSIILPSATGIAGQQYSFKRLDFNANLISVSSQAGQTIDGASSVGLNGQNTYLTIVSDGVSTWKVIGTTSYTGGTVTSFSKTDNWGIISSVTNATTTPNHTVGVDSATLSGKYYRRTDVLPVSAKRVTPFTTATTITPNASTTDGITVSALASGLTFANPTGSPTELQELWLRIKDNGTTQTITYGTNYRASPDYPMIVNTIAGKTMYEKFIYNAVDTKWDCEGALNNF